LAVNRYYCNFINGFHDTANVVATSIATRSLAPKQAIVLAALFNVAGAFFGTGVAATITHGLIDSVFVNDTLLMAALSSAIIWNLITWWFGIPSSSSHALIGSICGAALVQGGWSAVHVGVVTQKVIMPMIVSPIIGFVLAFIFMVILTNILDKYRNPRKSSDFLRELQAYSTALLAFSHGSNDAQKTMAVITMALFSFGVVTTMHIPFLVIVACAVAMGLGTLSGGMRIIKTLSTKVAKLRPANGFAAEMSTGLLILCASSIGLPVSTTQAASGSIMGAGSTGKFGVNWVVVRSMATAWILTLPACALFAMVMFKLFSLFA